MLRLGTCRLRVEVELVRHHRFRFEHDLPNELSLRGTSRDRVAPSAQLQLQLSVHHRVGLRRRRAAFTTVEHLDLG